MKFPCSSIWRKCPALSCTRLRKISNSAGGSSCGYSKWRTRKWRLNSTDLYWLVGWANRSVGCTPPLLGGSSNRKWWTELWLVNPRFVDYPIYNWLVVEPPLWKIWVSWGYYSQLNGKIIQMFQSTNQLQIYTVSTQEWIEKLETWKMWGTYHRYIFELPSW